MNSRISKAFRFSYPLQHKVVRNCRLVSEHVGDLMVEGMGYYNPQVSLLDTDNNRYDADIDFVKWNGTDIRPVLELSGMMDDITEAAVRYAAALFQNETPKGLAA